MSSDQLNFNDSGGATGNAVDVGTVFSHEAITDNDLIAKDKSDWFVKRVIIEAFPTLTIGDESKQALERNVMRNWSLAVGVMDNETAASWMVNGSQGTDYVHSADGYERWARIFRSWTRPVYRTYAPLQFQGNGGQTITLEWDGQPVDRRLAGEPYGPSSIFDDFTVSNAGVKDRQSLFLVAGPAYGPGSYSWQALDQLQVRVFLRVLLQARRQA